MTSQKYEGTLRHKILVNQKFKNGKKYDFGSVSINVSRSENADPKKWPKMWSQVGLKLAPKKMIRRI